MNLIAELEMVATAVQHAADTAEIPWPPPGPGPVPLDRFIEAFNLMHAELPTLTRGSAAAFLLARGIERADLLGDPTPLAGLLLANNAGGCILVRRDDPLPRRRFTAAHELGHYLLHFRPDDDSDGFMKVDEKMADLDDESALATMERQANMFAAELLMPAETCERIAREAAVRHGSSPRYVQHVIARELLVSREAARWRMRSLRLP